MTIYRQNREDRYTEQKYGRSRVKRNQEDPVNNPDHYKLGQGLEVIDLTEQLNFNRGNAVKYIIRAGRKSKETEIEDLEKAIWYIQREIQRLESG